MNLTAKLNNYLQIAEDGDCILFRGTSILSKAIEDISNGYFSHAATFYNNKGTPSVLECTTSFKAQLLTIFGLHKLVNGVTVTALNPAYLGGIEDFVVLRPLRTKAEINIAMAAGLDEIGKIKYDTLYLIQYAIWKLTGKALTHLVEKHSEVCVQLNVLIDGKELNMPEYANDTMSSPTDLYTLRNPANMKIFIDKN
jgi:hypothetical protein